MRRRPSRTSTIASQFHRLVPWTLVPLTLVLVPTFGWTQPPFMLPRPTRTLARVMSSPSVQEIAQRLVQASSDNAPPLVCIVVAGGGGTAVSTLASTEGASSLFLEGTITYDQNSFHSYTNLPKPNADDEDFRYVSSEAAQLLSAAALERALRYRPQLADQARCVGIGCTSSLVSAQSRSRRGRVSRGHIVATRADGRQWECRIKLAQDRRTRLQEDLLMSELVLTGIEHMSGIQSEAVVSTDDEDIVECWIREKDSSSEDVVEESARSIADGETGCVLLLPRGDSFVALRNPTLPQHSLVFPGSFNPPHIGHVALVNVAVTKWSDGGSCPAVLLELSVANPDKPSIDPKIVSERVHKFLNLKDLPDNWGVLLTSAPLFSQKVNIYSERIVTVDKESPKFAFVIGTDTMVRLLDPKYYGESQAAMQQAIFEMKRQGVRFVVGGRVENGKGGGDFVTGEEELRSLPEDLQSTFILVAEEEFRMDISSTEIRSRSPSR